MFGAFTFAAELKLDSNETGLVSRAMYIHKGWNLVQGLESRDLIVGGTDIEINNIKAIFGLNPISKKYIRFYPAPEKEEIDKLRYTANMTYWVYSNSDGTLNYQTEKVDITKFNWPSGWNIIPVASEFVNKSLDDIKGDCTIERAYWWSPREQKFINVKDEFLKISQYDNNVGTGLVFKFLNECKLSVLTNNGVVLPPKLPN